MTGDVDGIIERGGAAAGRMAASVLAECGAQTRKCANCAAPLIGPFCAVCGQEHDAHRRTIIGLLHDLVTDIVNFDSRILRTARALLLQPGELACAFREGRTRPYVPPVRLYLFVSLLFFLVLAFTNIGILQIAVIVSGQARLTQNSDNNYVLKIDPNRKIAPETIASARKFGIDLQPGQLDPKAVPIITGSVRFFAPIGSVQSRLPPQTLKMIANMRANVAKELNTTMFASSDKVIQGIEHIAKDPAAINGPLTVWVPRVLFLLVPLFAGVLMLFYLKARRHYFYVDHLVFTLNFFSATFVILLVTAGAAQVLPGAFVAGATMLALGTYLLLAMKRFYGQAWLRTTLKFAASMVIYLTFILAPAIAAVILMSISEA